MELKRCPQYPDPYGHYRDVDITRCIGSPVTRNRSSLIMKPTGKARMRFFCDVLSIIALTALIDILIVRLAVMTAAGLIEYPDLLR